MEESYETRQDVSSYAHTEQSEKPEISLSLLKNILDGMDAFVYVTDPETDKILFMNERMKNHFNLPDNPVGGVCWKLLQNGFDKRCNFCPNNALMENPNEPIVWEELNTITGRFYKNVDSIIEWADGAKVHMQHSTDITDLKMTENTLKGQLQRQQLMSAISQSFIANEDIHILINRALQMIGDFIGVSRIFLASYDKKNKILQPSYIWRHQLLEDSKQNDMPPLPAPFLDGDGSDERLGVLIVNDVEETDDYQQAKEFGVKSFLAIPIYVSGSFWGILSFEQCETAYKWTDSDIYLGNLFAGLLSGVISQQITESYLLRMSSIVNSSPQSVAFKHKNGAFDFFNPATCEITGYSHEELMAGGTKILYSDEINRHIQEEIVPRVFLQGKYNFEIPLIKKSGEERIMSFSAFTVPSEKDRYATIASDVTERKHLEQNLLEAKEMAEQASLAKSAFLSRMSHEMRTPMNAIIGMTSIAKNAKDLKKKEYCLDKIDVASKQLLGVINDILDMSKIESNKLELYYNEFNFEKMIMDIVDIVSFRVEEKKQELVVNVDKVVPVSIVSDCLRLSQVLTNLLANAIKFTPEGGTVTLNVLKTGGTENVSELRIEVSDTGIGISEEQQRKLFVAFEQADGGISRKYGGTGLGLAISKRIVNLMGGEIWIESQLGKGAKFVFTLKVENGKEKQETDALSIDKDNLRILVVDGSPEIREYFIHVMDNFGLSCDVAADGASAVEMIEKCKEDPYNIFFVDGEPPDVHGMELAKKIKQLTNNHATVMMISAVGCEHTAKEALDAGIDCFIPKPLFPSVLLNAIHEAIGISLDSRKEKVEKIIHHDFRKHTILLVEDVDVNKEIVFALLEDTGIKIDYARNGVEALALFQKQPQLYSLILMDVHMPEMGGYEATAKIRSTCGSEGKKVPIIAMTANAFKEDIEQCMAAGMNAHIRKPIDTDELLVKLNTYLQEPPKAEEYKPVDFDGHLKKSPNCEHLSSVINVQEGLSRLMNNKKLYFTLLRNFAGRQMADELIATIARGDMAQIAKTARALGGMSANLGLNALADVAASIETQSKKGVEVSRFIDSLNEAVDNAVFVIHTVLEGEGIL